MLKRHRGFVWGALDQSFSSATNFGLTVMAARLLGPQGLGVIAVGFGIYIIALGFQRALVSDPLVVVSSPQTQGERTASTRFALTIVVVASSALALLMALVGLVTPGVFGRALVLFSPWIVPTLVQDLWRSVLFRDDRGASAAANDGLWLMVMAVTAAVSWTDANEWAVVGSWGAGALAGALLGVSQTRVLPQAVRESWEWWRSEARNLGKWLAGEAAAYNLTSQTYLLILTGLLGPAAVGGLYAVNAAFAPLSLILPAITLPGLPIVVRDLTVSTARARGTAIKLSALVVTLAALYCVLLGVGGGSRFLGVIFGHSFQHYGFLILPVAIQQIVDAGGTGPLLLLKASRRVRAVFASRALIAPLGLTLATLLALFGDLLLVAWGNVLTRMLALALVTVLALRGRNSLRHRFDPGDISMSDS